METLEQSRYPAIDAVEEREWMESIDALVRAHGPQNTAALLDAVARRAEELGVPLPHRVNTPYVNTIGREHQPPFPGNRALERRIKSLIRWNAMAMVVRANRELEGIGGHISTYASAATLYEVGFNHFFKGPLAEGGGDMVYFQGHASPGIYARAYLEGRLSEEQLTHFRRELSEGGGLSSYPHPWLMPGFWQFPTVSMGLAPICAIYQARFNRYLENRGLLKRSGRVWCFVGDGEMDEPEAPGAISLAAREQLDNLVFVVNCNLQRLDGPVRGNFKVIQELETLFRGAGWNVIKVIWGDSWDPLLDKDTDGVLMRRMEDACDGDYQKYSVSGGDYIREHFFGTDDRLRAMVADLSDDELRKMRRGGHDPEKVHAAYAAAVAHIGSPTVILAKTIKGYGLGEAGEGMNITHQQKKMNEDELREFRERFDIPISDDAVGSAPFYRPPDVSPEISYLKRRREELGGFLPIRVVEPEPFPRLPDGFFQDVLARDKPTLTATTMSFARMLAKLLRHKDIGPRVVPIIPDEARTFGMDALFREFGIYSHVGQRYEPVDKNSLLYYKEDRRGQVLEEGITEAGSMASFIAAGSAYATHRLPLLPFFTFYSMFGFQRISDLIWAACDQRVRGFLVGATAGRTTLAGEGLQHQDGHSHLLAYPAPTVRAYDAALDFEIAVILEDGIRRMTEGNEDAIYYLTVENEKYDMPVMPGDCREGILRGLYQFRKPFKKKGARVEILGSGAILMEALRAQEILAERYDVHAAVWSVTSYKALHRDMLECERENRLRSDGGARIPYIASMLPDPDAIVVAATDYVKALPESVAGAVPGCFVSLGTDGFGRSEGRAALRDFFEVSAEHIAFAAISELARAGKFDRKKALRARADLGIDPERPDPVTR